ncbi:MAG: FkbM family methyltransferase, partial [Proteobacteria bacterium]|nr:FkbM family methyltransferase [Pseudomonadota bacterium]
PDPTGLTNRITEDEDGIIVPATSLDGDLTAGFKNRLSFLKIDVEGGELDVLNGARETMGASLHLLILFERLKNTQLDNLLEFFAAQNYSVFAVSDGLPTRSTEAIRRAHDLFACRNDRLDLINERASAAQTGR